MIELIGNIPLGIELINSNILKTYNDQPYAIFIYEILFIIVLVMTFLFINTLMKRKDVNKSFEGNFIMMDFLINFPVTLGVIGTLYSVSRSVTESHTNNLSEIISSNFDSAVMTTIVGGLVYGYCFVLQALLNKYIYVTKK